jgi:UDP-GlcNAc:undecaprenyl-phosphate/decaprenyl-phosphate GlcNAc-1-phosphate transferase
MTTIATAFLLAFLLSLLSTRLVMRLAWRLDMVDRPDGFRKVHERVTPRLGGVAIFVAFVIPVLVLFSCSELSTVTKALLRQKTELIGVLIGASIVLVFGVLDDKFDLRPRWKLLWQLATAGIMYQLGFSIGAVSIPFGGSFHLGLFALPVTLFWFVGCMNAVNLLDGLDGLAAGASLFVSMTLLLVSIHFNNVLGMLMMGCLSGAILGFLLFNFPPAKIFLGDSGSMLLGFLIAALSLVGASRKAEATVALFIPIVALGLPILDTSIAIVRRWYKKLPISAPDRQHIHHTLVSMGYSQRRAVLTLYVICLLLAAAALVITFARSEVVLFVIGSLIVTAFVCIRIFSGVRLADVLDKLSDDAERRQRSSQARVLMEQAVERMRHANGIAGLWSACVRVFEELGLDRAQLVLGSAPLDTWAWQNKEGESGQEDASADEWSARLGLRHDSRFIGELVVGKAIREQSFLPETAELLDRLRSELTDHILRVSPSPGRMTKTE